MTLRPLILSIQVFNPYTVSVPTFSSLRAAKVYRFPLCLDSPGNGCDGEGEAVQGTKERRRVSFTDEYAKQPIAAVPLTHIWVTMMCNPYRV